MNDKNSSKFAQIGVSQWREQGKKLGYWDYFAEQIREGERLKQCKHLGHNTIEEVTDGEILFCYDCHQVIQYAESPEIIARNY